MANLDSQKNDDALVDNTSGKASSEGRANLSNDFASTLGKQESGRGFNWAPSERSNNSYAPDYYELPYFFREGKADPPEMKKVGESADKVAQLLKSNASPEELKKAFDEFEKEAREPGVKRLADAAQRLEDAFIKNGISGKYSAELANGKFSVSENGSYQNIGHHSFENQGRFYDPSKEQNSVINKSVEEFVKDLSQGMSSKDLNARLSGLLRDMSNAGIFDLAAQSMLSRAIDHATNRPWEQNGRVFEIDGKPVQILFRGTMTQGVDVLIKNLNKKVIS